MKLFVVTISAALAQYDEAYTTAYTSAPANSGCGPSAAYGGAFWPSQTADDTCGVNFTANMVAANSKCHLQLLAGTSSFLTLGGVFVTSPASLYSATDFYFHTYENWAVSDGAQVTNFWQNPGFPEETGCYDADAICITCTPEPDMDGDGKPDKVQGAFLGNFMHDFRHDQPSNNVNVPIAHDGGHLAGNVYTVTLYDQYGSIVPITDIASHYGHLVNSDLYDMETGIYGSTTGVFDVKVGCEDFLGDFLYVSFTHTTTTEANGWYSYVTVSQESTADCPVPEDVINWESAPSEEAAGEQTTSTYSGSAEKLVKPAKQSKPNRPNKNGQRVGEDFFAPEASATPGYDSDDYYVENNYNY